jgi:CrcB protein
MMAVLMVALGGAAGSVARYFGARFFEQWLSNAMGLGFPYGTLSVNLIGSFTLGVVIEIFSLVFLNTPELRLFLVVGVLGGFTTFSAFSLDTVALLERGEVGRAVLYVGLSVVLSAGALFVAVRFFRWALS